MSHPLARPLFLTVAVVLGFAPLQAQTCPNPGSEQGPHQHYTGAGTTTCNCFAPNEEAGVVFNNIPAAAFPIIITKVGIGWGSAQGGALPTVEDSIQFYLGGTSSTNNIGSLPAPQMTDGFINEFDAEPYNIIISSQPFKVTLRFFNDNQNGSGFVPTMIHDGNGCQPGKNVVKAVTPFSGWFDACTLGVSGDWQFHIKYKSCNGGAGGGTGTAYCFGDGSGNSCPCDPGQAGGAGEGCMNSTGVGGQLSATGVASVAGDSVQLHAVGMPNPTTVLFFQGNIQQNGGQGSLNADGLLCVNQSVIRLGTKPGSPGTADYGAGVGGDVPISIKGLIPAGGATRHYQAWYRDNSSFCTSATSNFTNGLTIAWGP